MLVVFLLVYRAKDDVVVTVDPILTPTITPIPQKTAGKKIGVVADIHNDVNSLEKALKKMKTDGVAEVLVAGDLSINGTEDELKRVKTVLDDSGIKYLAVPGNHDLYKNKFLTVWGKEWQSQLLGELKLIMINNGNWRCLGEDQKRWIGEEVKECKEIRCVVVMHEPLGHYLTAHVMGEYSKTTAGEAMWLNELLLSNEVEEIFVGHLHFSSEYVFAGLKSNVVGAISKERNNQTPRFMEISSYKVDGQQKLKLESEVLEVE